MVEAFGAVKLGRTLVLAVIVAALGAYIWLVEKPRLEAEKRPDKLVEFDVERVARLRLVYPKDPAITVEKRDDDDWWITEPLEADADDRAVTRLLEQLAKAQAERRIPSDEAQPLATYGLEGDGTQARVSITLDGGTKLPDIVIGDTTPVGFQAFVRVEGNDEVVVVPLIVHSGVKKSVFDLREKKLFDFNPNDGIAVTLAREGTTIVLRREGDRWRITAPVDDLADKNQVTSLLRSLEELEALAFYDGDAADRSAFGLDHPSLELHVELGGGKTVALRVGNKTPDSPPGYYVERVGDGQVAKIAEWHRNRLDKGVNDLRDKKLFDCKVDEIARVSYERRDGDSFALVKGDDGTWRVEPDPGRGVKQAVVRRALSGLAGMAGTEIAAESADTKEELALYGLDEPVAEVTVVRGDGNVCGAAQAGVIGADSGNPAYYVRRVDSGTVMSVPAYLYSRLDVRADNFLEAPGGDAGDTNPAAAGKDED